MSVFDHAVSENKSIVQRPYRAFAGVEDYHCRYRIEGVLPGHGEPIEYPRVSAAWCSFDAGEHSVGTLPDQVAHIVVLHVATIVLDTAGSIQHAGQILCLSFVFALWHCAIDGPSDTVADEA